MEEYFNICYCFDKQKVHSTIGTMVLTGRKGYVCVADGVTLAKSYKDKNLKAVLDTAGLTVCDSGWVPLYIKVLYNIEKNRYCGSDLLMDLVELKKYKLMFIGATPEILSALRDRLIEKDSRIASMEFMSLPVLPVDEFDYKSIAESVEQANPDIVFVSLGMPKQEFFMCQLIQYLKKGVLIGVGAAFKYHSGLIRFRRAPEWMIRAKVEWLFRILREPKKQIKRCILIITVMPRICLKEYRMRTEKLKNDRMYYPSECER